MRKTRVLLTGRFGNQLWQIAFAHYLIDIGHEVELIYLDANIGNNSVEAQDQLERLVSTCSHGIEIEFVKKSARLQRALYNPSSRMQNANLPFRKIIDVRKEPFHVLSNKELQSGGVYIGYFQNRGLLENQICIVQNELIRFLTNEGRIPKKGFERKNVFHIRYGDYLSEKNREVFGVLSETYYRNVLEFSSLTKYDVAWVTDDPIGVRANMPYLKDIEILGPKELDYLDVLGVFTRAQLVALSNSSFAWWGGMCTAWNGGQIISPDPWTKSDYNSGKSLLNEIPGSLKVSSRFI